MNQMRITRVGAAVALTTATLVSAGAGTASAENLTYIERPCLVRSVGTSGGANGDGCSVYGISQWISTEKRAGMPEQMKADLRNCIVEGAAAAVTVWFHPPAAASAFTVLGVLCVGPSVARALVP